jgi:HK97 family phage prohead protease
MLTKVLDSALQLESGSRTVVAIISTDAVDRDGEVVLPKGMRKKAFQGNPVVFTNHDYFSLPIGKALWVKAEPQRVLAKYQVSDKTPEAQEVWDLLRDGILQAHSIGFVSHHASPPTPQEIQARPDWATARLVHRDWELLEFSVVGVPANPEALALAVSKGYSRDVLRKLFGPQVTRSPRLLGRGEITRAVIAQLAAGLRQIPREALLRSVRNMACGRIE